MENSDYISGRYLKTTDMRIYTLIKTEVPDDFIITSVIAASTSYEEMLNRLEKEAKTFFNKVVKDSVEYDSYGKNCQWDEFYNEDDSTWEINCFCFFVQFYIITSEI